MSHSSYKIKLQNYVSGWKLKRAVPFGGMAELLSSVISSLQPGRAIKALSYRPEIDVVHQKLNEKTMALFAQYYTAS